MKVETEGLTSVEALGVAIRSETDARDLYREMAERCEDPLLARRFELLAAEEERHREILISKWQEVAGGVELKLPPSRLPETLASRDQRRVRTLTEVLDLAIEEERRSWDFCLRAARETADLSGQAMFRFLADIGRSHWMALCQERELLARYPNYGRRGPRPWRVEGSLASGVRTEE